MQRAVRTANIFARFELSICQPDHSRSLDRCFMVQAHSHALLREVLAARSRVVVVCGQQLCRAPAGSIKHKTVCQKSICDANHIMCKVHVEGSSVGLQQILNVACIQYLSYLFLPSSI